MSPHPESHLAVMVNISGSFANGQLGWFVKETLMLPKKTPNFRNRTSFSYNHFA